MRVEVGFYSLGRDVIATSALSLEMPAGSTLRDLLKESIRLCGEKLRDRLLTHTGDLEANVQIFVGAEQSASLEEVVANGRESSEVKIFVLSATCGG